MENPINNFKDLQFKHKRQNMFQAMHGELSEDAMFIAFEQYEEKRKSVFNEIDELVQSEVIF